MLAYVFWHWPKKAASVVEYEAALTAFHDTVRHAAASVLVSSSTWSVGALPWIPGADQGFADWYLIEDFAALGALNQAAVAGRCRAPHDAVADLSAGGTGGVYRLRAGAADTTGDSEAWFPKPDGHSYHALDALLREASATPGFHGLWQRQLVLGPGPEFCLLSMGSLPLPPALQTSRARRRPIDPRSGSEPN